MVQNKKDKSNLVIFTIVLIILLVIATAIIIRSGAFEKAINPCEKEFSDCNYGCGEGILNSICKEKCTYDYGVCQNE